MEIKSILSNLAASAKKKSVDKVAREVLQGKWGAGEERKKKLKRAGYNYNAVQKRVNQILAARKPLKTVAQEVIKGKWGEGETRKAKLKGAGYDYDAVQKEVNKIIASKTSIQDKILKACKEQSIWSRNSAYKWEEKPTIEKSKKKETCVTYVGCVLQRVKLLEPGEYIWHNGKGYGTGKVYGTNSKMTVTYMGNKTLKSLKKKLKKGDIVLLDDNKSGNVGGGGHIFILTGKWDKNGNPYIWDNVTAQRGNQEPYAYNGNRKVLAIVRV